MRTYHIHAVDGKPNVYHEEFTDSMRAWLFAVACYQVKKAYVNIYTIN